ncbi:predicted protein [Histoplasma capsulatum G186AR]|uniref:Uncharacterized protein n=2 Tax=Ajellomyces capsulatus TaxID=5037 RepID=C0P122_AJECG|nr:uncharacterized protein HCBG_09102 [Histoplasma capsulatum G186AR]EEH02658.1 predicted protein [Histoplasma capsulatum G186AR]
MMQGSRGGCECGGHNRFSWSIERGACICTVKWSLAVGLQMSTNSKEDKVSMHCTSHWSFEFIKRIRRYTKEELFKTQEAHSIRNEEEAEMRLETERRTTERYQENKQQRRRRRRRQRQRQRQTTHDNENKWFDYMVTAQEQETECKRGKGGRKKKERRKKKREKKSRRPNNNKSSPAGPRPLRHTGDYSDF